MTIELIIALGAVLVILLGGLVALLRPGRRRRDIEVGPSSAPGSIADSGSDSIPAGDSPATTHPDRAPPAVADQALGTATDTLERPAPVVGRMQRLRARLARSNTALGKGLLTLLTKDRIDEATWEEIEDTLLAADLGVDPATELVDKLRTRVAIDGTRDAEHVKAMLREEMLALVNPNLDRELNIQRTGLRPAVVLVVGVNGTGKTTTVGKLARVLVAEDKDVVLGAADTFRAAAADQLTTWGDRVGVPTIRSDKPGADPAAVAFDAVTAGIATEADVVVIDTAGRLQNKAGLMDELGKVKRVAEKAMNGETIDEVLLVLDATVGQNGLRQAQVFAEVVNVTGIVLTKLDGTAKGGIVVAVQRQLGVPVKLVGLGEGPDDLAPFDPEVFVDALLS